MSTMSNLQTTLAPRPRRGMRIFLAMLIFFGGMVCGAGLTVIISVRHIRYAIHHPEEVPDRLTRYLTRRLDLSADQSEKVENLIVSRQARLQAIRRDVQPRVRMELDELRQEIGDVLTPEQKAKWEGIFDEAIDRWMPPPPPATQPF